MNNKSIIKNNNITVPLVSVIIPVYNRPILIKESLQSLLWQTYQNWECIIVDDGSTDNTWDVLQEFEQGDSRIKIFKRERKPKGANACRNIGIENSTGKYIIFLDSDDILAPWSLQTRINNSYQKDFDMMISQVFEFDNSDPYNRRVRTLFEAHDPYKIFLDFEIPWGTSAVMWNAGFLRKIGGWYEPAQCWQDVILNIIALNANAKVIWGDQVPDVFMRVQPGFDKISNTYSIDRLINKSESLLYLKSQIKDKDFKKFETKYISDIVNRIEFLSDESINEAIKKDFDFIRKVKKVPFLKSYFKLYVLSRNSIIHPLVYHSRNLFTIRRKKLLILRPYITQQNFNELILECKKYPFLEEKLHFIKENRSNYEQK